MVNIEAAAAAPVHNTKLQVENNFLLFHTNHRNVFEATLETLLVQMLFKFKQIFNESR